MALKETRIVLFEKYRINQGYIAWILEHIDDITENAIKENKTSIKIPTFWTKFKVIRIALMQNRYYFKEYVAMESQTIILIPPYLICR